MITVPAFFERSGEEFRPLPLARSLWSDQALLGPAVCGLLAHELERQCLPEGFSPARFFVELHRPVPAVPLSVRTSTSRNQRRLCAASAELMAGDKPVARATLAFLRKSGPPPGEMWTSTRKPPVPPDDFPDDQQLYASDEFGGWSTELSDHMNSSRKRTWMPRVGELVAREKLSAFVAAAILGDQANLVCHWGTEGVGYINIDLSMTFARLPESVPMGMGIEVDSQFAAEGISSGTAIVYDHDGPIATATVSALANPLRQVDLASLGKESVAEAS
ncbi:acyl-CoA thioesterase domain-containing protein [Nocardia sp. NBC_01327]|uniref:acyl-CoA thioesterase domain-containing protein n=1 Tax=Nocardia sp. NBC_01327 TaxID=2903593 RepID=UPI002E11E89C|nr:thioesterase family protein [Nocardia sp. NBC_01327]